MSPELKAELEQLRKERAEFYALEGGQISPEDDLLGNIRQSRRYYVWKDAQKAFEPEPEPEPQSPFPMREVDRIIAQSQEPVDNISRILSLPGGPGGPSYTLDAFGADRMGRAAYERTMRGIFGAPAASEWEGKQAARDAIMREANQKMMRGEEWRPKRYHEPGPMGGPNMSVPGGPPASNALNENILTALLNQHQQQRLR